MPGKGYWFDKQAQRWIVRVRCNGKCVFGGRHKTEELAQAAAKTLRAELHGRWLFLLVELLRQPTPVDLLVQNIRHEAETFPIALVLNVSAAVGSQRRLTSSGKRASRHASIALPLSECNPVTCFS